MMTDELQAAIERVEAKRRHPKVGLHFADHVSDAIRLLTSAPPGSTPELQPPVCRVALEHRWNVRVYCHNQNTYSNASHMT